MKLINNSKKNKKMENKKFYLSVLLAGLVGGIITMIGTKYLFPGNNYVIVNGNETKAKNISSPNVVYPFNLTKAAKSGTKVVVHIRAEESVQNAKKRLNRNPLGGFFNDMFDFGYNNEFYRMKGGGSGVIISKDGYIVTNNHVVDFADNIIVTLPDKREYKAKKIGTDPSTDLAVIKIDETGLPVIPFADSDNAKLGEWVLAIGNPFDYLTSSVTAGIISAKGRNINIIQDEHALEEFIQTDAAVNPGNSGGALVDANGKLLGITSAIATPTGSYAGYSFAIPVNLMKKVVDKIIEKGGNLSKKPSLGVSAATIDKEIQKKLNLEVDYGVYVDEVITGSSAEFAGILPGDVIVGVDGKEIRKFEDLREVLNFVKIGDILNFKILRDNKYTNIKVKLKQSL